MATLREEPPQVIERRAAFGFRPDVEGLRAVAVGLVIALHAGATVVSGGYIGVDVFFVISGFLITSLLLAEVGRTGRVSVASFYARRARRILPAACFVIAITVVAAYLRLGSVSGARTANDGRWAAVFLANVHFIRQGTNYFATGLPPSPLQHYWSLAVEEQFYLVWPTLVLALVLLGRRARLGLRVLHVGIAAVVVASLAWSIRQSGAHPTSAYFSPFTRAWELGIGALVAVGAARAARVEEPIRAIATWVGLALVLFAAFTFTSTTVFPGWAALVPVGGTALILAGGIGGARRGVSTWLATPPLRWIGRISFSLYLWHWVVFQIAEQHQSTPLSNQARLACVALTVVLSVATYYAIERPFHASSLLKPRRAGTEWRRDRRSFLAGAVAIVVALGVSASVYHRATSGRAFASAGAPQMSLTDGLTPSMTLGQQMAAMQARATAFVQDGLALHALPRNVDPPPTNLRMEAKYGTCENTSAALKPCIFGAPNGRQTLVAFGDSHTLQWMPAIDEYATSAGYRVVAMYKLACPIPSIAIYTSFGPFPECAPWREKALEYIEQLKPAAVVTAFGTENMSRGSFDKGEWLAGLQTTLRRLKAATPQVVEIGNNAVLPQDPALCLTKPNVDVATCTGKYANREVVDAEADIVRRTRGTFVDVEPWYCVEGRCPAIIGTTIAYRDNDHLEPQYVRVVEPLLAANFKRSGLQ